MNNLSQVISFFIYLVLQVVFIRHWALFDVAFCFIYISFLLFLPFSMNLFLMMLIGFVTGITVDLFYDTLGVHAFSCVLLTYMRPYLANLIKPSGGYEANMKPYLSFMGFRWFLTYTVLLTTIHHLSLFFLEAWSMNLLFFTLSKAILSIVFTSFVIVLFQYIFYKEN
ncbi:Rod shape-determining protein MreD [Thermoflexibacter ruber]|uniref:Rod shape-determining protein MreD n=1 Tax=Thermoflexibacter ruber TaxID=1003 RepID=A0A1I2H207_9BACT|nr:Rod shape-determining protein MreD [Thermoflexibacter ruber]SFF24284.1 hypothetical protein SAMN04488541_102184 [Thermoflexibacter ruber]